MAKHRKQSGFRRRLPIALRTAITAAITLFPLLNLILLAVLETAQEYEVYLPKTLFIALNAGLLIITAATALFTRLIAVPGLIQWLEKHLIGPEDKYKEPS